MTEPDDLDLAELWREQVDPRQAEAELRQLSKDIERSALRRRRIDFSLGAAALAVVAFYLVNHPTYWKVYLAGAAIAIGGLWVRHHLHKAARALATCDPEKYCEAALKHARAELRFSTFCLWAVYPVIVIMMLMLRLTETGSLELAIPDLFGRYLARLLLATATSVGVILFFLVDNRRLRDQIRRLEILDREREAEEARDLTEER